jgi:hypothetical protein
MDTLQQMEQERNVLRWGGLAGILGGLLFISALVAVIVGPVGMEDPAGLAEWVTRFPDIKAARIVENLIYLTALMLEVPLFLALYRALRGTSLAPALFGSVLGIVGLVAMMVSALPHVAHSAIFDVYHLPEMTLADQATIVLMWQAIWGMIDVATYVGFFVVSTSLIIRGAGMIGSPAFGKGYGGVAVVLGVVGLATAVLQIIDPASMFGIGSYFAGLIFYFVVGWKLFNLSRAS